jgi:hypothetical protein
MRTLSSLPLAAMTALFVAVFSGCGGGSGGGGGDDGDDRLHVGILYSGTNFALDTEAKLELSGEFASVKLENCGGAIISLEELLEYDVVLVMGDVDFADATEMGNVLADGVDAGVGVVLAVFTTAYPNTLGGRFATDNYYAILGSNTQAQDDGPFGWDEEVPGHPLLTDVSTFGAGAASFRPGAGTALVAGSTLVATWLDPNSTPLIVERDLLNGMRRVDLGFWPVTTDAAPDGGVEATSDAMQMVINALLRVGGQL